MQVPNGFAQAWRAPLPSATRKRRRRLHFAMLGGVNSVSGRRGSTAMTVDEARHLASKQDQSETVGRLIAAVTTRGAAVLARVDHAGGAASVGLAVLNRGRPVRQSARRHAAHADRADDGDRPSLARLGVDRRLRDDAPTPDDPGWLALRHGAGAGHEATLGAMRAFSRGGRRSRRRGRPFSGRKTPSAARRC